MRGKLGELVDGGGCDRAHAVAPRRDVRVDRREPAVEELVLTRTRRGVAFDRRETLGRGGDVAVSGLDLLVQERALIGDLTDPLLPRAELLLGRGQVVGEVDSVRDGQARILALIMGGDA